MSAACQSYAADTLASHAATSINTSSPSLAHCTSHTRRRPYVIYQYTSSLALPPPEAVFGWVWPLTHPHSLSNTSRYADIAEPPRRLRCATLSPRVVLPSSRHDTRLLPPPDVRDIFMPLSHYGYCHAVIVITQPYAISVIRWLRHISYRMSPLATLLSL